MFCMPSSLSKHYRCGRHQHTAIQSTDEGAFLKITFSPQQQPRDTSGLAEHRQELLLEYFLLHSFCYHQLLPVLFSPHKTRKGPDCDFTTGAKGLSSNNKIREELTFLFKSCRISSYTVAQKLLAN